MDRAGMTYEPTTDVETDRHTDVIMNDGGGCVGMTSFI